MQKHEALDLGKGILAAIQKAGKPKGPVSNLRPIVLLTSIRKVLSLITLNRIKGKVDAYISPSQAAYRKGRSTSDIVWTHKWIASAAIRYKQCFSILGLDMSRAFDTISRSKMLDILREDVGLEDDELRMCQLLLANTSLQVRLEDVLSQCFKTTIGTPQGDGLSPILFIVYLEKALRDVRAQAPPKPLEDRNLPNEAIYADDTDFISTNTDFLKSLETIIPPIIGKYDLIANAQKWEKTKIELGSDEWKKVKKLGSLLGDEEDVNRRISLANTQFKSLEKIWGTCKNISLPIKLRVYNALVLSVLLYNAGTWGLNEKVSNKLNVLHRSHLRRIIGIRWPKLISNDELYKRCESQPLCETIRKFRWQLFGHCLRLPLNTPAQIAMSYYCDTYTECKLDKGRTVTTLPTVLFNEFHMYKQSLKKSLYRQKPVTALRELRKLASKEKEEEIHVWTDLVHDICSLKVISESDNTDPRSRDGDAFL